MTVSLQLIKHIKRSRKFCFLLLFCFPITNIRAQQDSIQQKEYSLEVQVFARLFSYNETAEPLNFSSDLKRTLLIYQQCLSNNFSFCLAADTYAKNKEKPNSLTPYLKRAFLEFHSKQLSVSAGLLVTEQFKFQRKIWSLRYIDKTFQNKYEYGENRSIGVFLKHKLNKCFVYDVAFSTGYNTPIKHASEKYTLMSGQTIRTKLGVLRLFNRVSFHPDYEYIFSLFATKKTRKGNLGIEAARKFAENNPEDEGMYGFSVFGNYFVANNMMCFARYDVNKEFCNVTSENMIWGGLQYSFKKYLTGSIYYKSKNFNTNYVGLAVFFNMRSR